MKASSKIPSSVEVMILGGGVHGVGVLHDCVSRGLKNICLVEKNTLASGTSSKSTKLIHGGLRYLERLSQISMVFESLRERKFLLSVVPDLVKPIEILVPLLQSDIFNRAKIKIGLGLYDYLAKKSLIKKHTGLDSKQVQSKAPILKEKYLKRVFSYWDAQTDDKLLVKKIAKSAQEFGGNICEQTEVKNVKDHGNFWEVCLENEGECFSVNTKYIINCLGPWTNKFFKDNPSLQKDP